MIWATNFLSDSNSDRFNISKDYFEIILYYYDLDPGNT